eukprot:CAMPEP_0117581732 /NCGR_PEP_ID=MMETSP0784-20121206/66004_1 /TAXON_ID=39447 /ORGANISM="" /LENGTH=447 /DNA_ID=CAMNT_0005382103 /DNA_START=71 /DNA_END=1414 /DNA_ORIENTATION=+
MAFAKVVLSARSTPSPWKRLTPSAWRFATAVAPGQHQTPIVDALWQRRLEAKERARTNMDSVPTKAQGGRVLVAKPPSASASTVKYEFSDPQKAALRDKYRNPWGTFRVGRLFEDLDALAGTVAYEHCRSENPNDEDLHIVTASVDRIKYLHRANLKDDIVLYGKVTYVGKSSMEIRMTAVATWTDKPFMESYFTFVARDPSTGKAAAINPLKVSGEEEERLFALGEQRTAQRKQHREKIKNSALGKALDKEGLAAAKELLSEAKTLMLMPTLAEQSEIMMSETSLQNTLTAMPQHRNTAGKIFGGFLIRRAYELANATAYLFGGRRPVFHELDQVIFRSPVNVGDLLRLQSCVLYTSENIDQLGRATVHVEVVADVLTPEKRQAVTSNIFNFTFGLAENSDGTGKSIHGGDIDLRRVVPTSLEESCRVIERYQADLEQLSEDLADQ